MRRKGMLLLVATFVLCPGAVFKAANTSETPEAVVERHLESLKSHAFENASAHDKALMIPEGKSFLLTDEKGKVIGQIARKTPYITNILLVKAQPSAEPITYGNAQTCQVLYVVEMKLAPEFAQARLAYLKKQRLAYQKDTRNKSKEVLQEVDRKFQASIERVQAAHYLVHAIAAVNRTAAGWQLSKIATEQIDVDLRAWALDIGWDPKNPYSTRVVD